MRKTTRKTYHNATTVAYYDEECVFCLGCASRVDKPNSLRSVGAEELADRFPPKRWECDICCEPIIGLDEGDDE